MTVGRGGKPPVLRIGDIAFRAASRLAPLPPWAICGRLFFDSASWPTQLPSRRGSRRWERPPQDGFEVVTFANAQVRRAQPEDGRP